MAIAEAMRLRPPAWIISRQATEAVEVGGFPVRAGTVVLMRQWVVHGEPRWYDAPER
jgi:cytochrome P450